MSPAGVVDVVVLKRVVVVVKVVTVVSTVEVVTTVEDVDEVDDEVEVDELVDVLLVVPPITDVEVVELVLVEVVELVLVEEMLDDVEVEVELVVTVLDVLVELVLKLVLVDEELVDEVELLDELEVVDDVVVELLVDELLVVDVEVLLEVVELVEVVVVGQPQVKLPDTAILSSIGWLAASDTSRFSMSRATVSPGMQEGAGSVSRMVATSPVPGAMVCPPNATMTVLMALSPGSKASQRKPVVRVVQSIWLKASSSGVSRSAN
jgi:hypothetical protein